MLPPVWSPRGSGGGRRDAAPEPPGGETDGTTDDPTDFRLEESLVDVERAPMAGGRFDGIAGGRSEPPVSSLRSRAGRGGGGTLGRVCGLPAAGSGGGETDCDVPEDGPAAAPGSGGGIERGVWPSGPLAPGTSVMRSLPPKSYGVGMESEGLAFGGASSRFSVSFSVGLLSFAASLRLSRWESIDQFSPVIARSLSTEPRSAASSSSMSMSTLTSSTLAGTASMSSGSIDSKEEAAPFEVQTRVPHGMTLTAALFWQWTSELRFLVSQPPMSRPQ